VVTDAAPVQEKGQAAVSDPVSVIQPAASDTTPVRTDRKNAPHSVAEAVDSVGSDTAPVSFQPAATPDIPLTAPVTTAAMATTQAHPTPPAAQITPTLLTLARTANGAQQMTVRLHPAELGMVQIRIERAASGLTQIDITVDKPETLLALQRDQPALHRSLDQAGVPPAGRTISFHAVPPSAASSGGSTTTTFGHNSGQHALSARSGFANTDADSSAGGRGGYLAREGNRWQNARQQTAEPEDNGANAQADGRTYRAGLDITA
jgi:hypothetical protein